MTTPTLLPPERLAEIKGRCDAAQKGPWCWYGSTYGDGRYYLATDHSGRRTVMAFRRSGTQGAQPEFQVDKRMVPAAELVRFDVDPTVKGKTAGKASPSVYRFDFSEIDHPDAQLIQHCADDIPALLDHITALTRERDAERESRFKTDAALRMKDDAVNTLMERLARKHGDRCEDLIS